MLVIANGADKCGSTWLASIIMEIVQPEPLPSEFEEGYGPIPAIKPRLIREFLEKVDYEHHNYVSKSHFFYERHLFARYKNVYVVDIHRDMPDMVISLFFHGARRQMEQASLEEIRKAYWQHGPRIVEHIARYHAIWRTKTKWTYLSSYERLKEDPRMEIEAIAAFLKIALTGERIDKIIEDTAFHRLADRLSGT